MTSITAWFKRFSVVTALLSVSTASISVAKANNQLVSRPHVTVSGMVLPAIDKVVYLTFDDGPSLIYTPKILTVLRQKDVHATFFVLGSRVKSFPQITRLVVQNGHEIGNHGFQHDYPTAMTSPVFVADVRRTDRAIRQITGCEALYYRPPGGLITSKEVSNVQRLGHPLAGWAVDSRDWNAKSSKEIVNRVLRNVRPGSIILLHDGVSASRWTVQALPVIIDALKARGYHFRTLPTYDIED